MHTGHFEATDLLLRLGAIAMFVAGILLIVWAYWIYGDALTRHVDLVVPYQSQRMARRGGLRPELIRAPRDSVANEDQREIVHRLARLGIPASLALRLFLAMRGVAAAAMTALAFLVSPHILVIGGSSLLQSLLGIGLGVAGWFIPVVVIRRLSRRRIAAVARGLPEALELLVVCFEAGLALDSGIAKVAIELRTSQPALAEELATTSADLKMLPSREQALEALAQRVNVPAIHSLVSTLSQTMKFGTPLSHTIRVVAAELRNDMIIQIEERANKLPVLMTIPMMLFILPTIFLVVAAPAALKLIDTFLR
jgi:tight adherence protein C